MAGSRLRRFLRLELPGLSRRRRRGTASVQGRFGPEPEPVAVVLENEAGAAPAVRCARCGASCGVLDPRCRGCGADLDRPEQRAFEEREGREARERAAEGAAREAERRMLQRRSLAEARAGTEEAERPSPRADPARISIGAAAAAMLALAVTAGLPEGWGRAALVAAGVALLVLLALRWGGRGS